MTKSRFTEKEKAYIRSLHDESGLSYHTIAAQYGVSTATINRICRPALAAKQAAFNKQVRSKYAAREAEIAKVRNKRFSLTFHRTNDSAVIEQLEKQENINDYVRNLILRDIEEQS